MEFILSIMFIYFCWMGIYLFIMFVDMYLWFLLFEVKGKRCLFKIFGSFIIYLVERESFKEFLLIDVFFLGCCDVGGFFILFFVLGLWFCLWCDLFCICFLFFDFFILCLEFFLGVLIFVRVRSGV